MAALAIAGAACTRPPSQPTPPAPQATDNRYGAPEVTQPRDIRGFANAPCTLLRREQIIRQGYDPDGRERRDQFGSECIWKEVNELRELTLSPWGDRDILVDTYRARLFPIFTPIEIDGLPAVIGLSSPNSGTCTVTTATARGQGLDTAVTTDVSNGRPSTDPCREAIAVTRTVIGNLPPAR